MTQYTYMYVHTHSWNKIIQSSNTLNTYGGINYFSCIRLFETLDCSLPGSSVHGILQTRILGLPCPPLGDLPDPGIKPASLMYPALAGGFFITSTTGEAITLLAHSGIFCSILFLLD